MFLEKSTTLISLRRKLNQGFVKNLIRYSMIIPAKIPNAYARISYHEKEYPRMIWPGVVFLMASIQGA